jgi:magnesium transporter
VADRRPRFLLPNLRPQGARTTPAEAVSEAPEVSMEARPEDVAAPVEQSMVDAGLYVGGKRVGSPTTVADAASQLRSTKNAML